MAISTKASYAYTQLKRAYKIRTYGKLIKEAIDEETRPGGVTKLAIRSLLEIAGKALGTSLTRHPYFQFHKVHLEALAQALNASSSHDKALEALNSAIRSADAASLLTKSLEDYQSRKTILKLTYAQFLEGSLMLQRDHTNDPRAAQRMKEAGLTSDSLKSYIDTGLYEWRARWCELFFESLELLAMAQVELRITEAAMATFDQKMKSMSSGGSIGKVAAYGVERDRQWQQYERMTNNKAGSAKAVEDPVGYARDQVQAIEKVTDVLGECCEIAMSEDANRPGMILQRIGNK